MIYADVTPWVLDILAEVEYVIIELYAVSCGNRNDGAKQVLV